MQPLRYANDPPADRQSDENVAIVRARIAESPQADEERIVRYLQLGNAIAWSTHFIDVISGHAVEATAYLTDGEWVWTNALPYYIERYHWRVEPEFIAHMRKREWRVAAANEIDLKEVTERLFS